MLNAPTLSLSAKSSLRIRKDSFIFLMNLATSLPLLVSPFLSFPSSMIAQLDFSTWSDIEMIKNLLKSDQVQKFDQPEKPTKRSYLLATSFKMGGSIDFSGSQTPFFKNFTGKTIRDILVSHFKHLVSSCFQLDSVQIL
jgi:hypothetical protein